MTSTRRFGLIALACLALGAILTTAVAWGSVCLSSPRRVATVVPFQSPSDIIEPPVAIPQWMKRQGAYDQNAWGVRFEWWSATERRDSDLSDEKLRSRGIHVCYFPGVPPEPPRSTLYIERLSCGWPFRAFEAVNVRSNRIDTEVRPIPESRSAAAWKFWRAKHSSDHTTSDLVTLRSTDVVISGVAYPSIVSDLWIPTALPLQPIPAGFLLNTLFFALIAYLLSLVPSALRRVRARSHKALPSPGGMLAR